MFVEVEIGPANPQDSDHVFELAVGCPQLRPLEILAWQGEPEAHLLCSREGGLRLRSVEVSAWQAVHLARKWDDPGRKPDTGTAQQLRELFARVRAALQAWVELTDHLLHAR